MSDHEQELHDKTRDIVSDVLDLIAGDAEFREALKTDPTLALQTAGFASRIDDLFDEVEADAEVSGFASFAPSIGSHSRQAILGGTILQSNTVSGGCSQGCLQNRFLPGIDFSKWG